MRIPKLIPAVLLLTAALAAPVSAQDTPVETDGIGTSALFRTLVIHRPGSYFLPHNVKVGNITAIEIRSDDVTLDLRGHAILGLGGLRGVGIAIRDAENVRVFGGALHDLAIGVQVERSKNVSIEGLRIDGEDLGGAPPAVEIGILLVDTKGARVADNTITETFLGIFVRGEESGGNRITGNTITGGAHGELAICYNPAPGAGEGGPDGDLVADNLISHFRRGMSFNADSTGNVVRGNSVAYFDLGIVEATAGSNVIDGNDEIAIAP